MMTEREANAIEYAENVYIDRERGMYNRESREAVYGWQAIPESWITKHLMADTINGVTFDADDDAELLQPQEFYDRLSTLGDGETIFTSILNDDADVYQKISEEYGIR